MEDSAADAGLVREALEEHEVACELILITNGELAIKFIEGVEAEHAHLPRPGYYRFKFAEETGQ